MKLSEEELAEIVEKRPELIYYNIGKLSDKELTDLFEKRPIIKRLFKREPYDLEE